MSKPVVSVIIPVYNVEKYLNQCVDSIISQEYEKKEIILVDDGSNDSSGTICDEYSDKYDYIKTVHKSNGGLSDARNTGLEHCQGDYVLFVDSDDYIERGSLSNVMKCVSDNNVDVVFLEAQKVFPDGAKEPLGDGITGEGINGKSKEEILSFLSLCPKYPGSACTKLIKKTLFEHSEMKFKNGVFSEDIDWTFKLIMVSEIFAYCPHMYYNYRQNREGSITNTNASKRLKDLYDIIYMWYKASDDMEESEQKFILSSLAYEYQILLFLYAQVSTKFKKEYRKKLSSLKHLLKYRRGLRYKGTYILCKVLGIDITSYLIRLYMNCR